MDQTKQETDIRKAESRTKKREDKCRRRDVRSLDNVQKAMALLGNNDGDKCHLLEQRYSELYEEYRVVKNTQSAMEKKTNAMQRERDQLQAEQSKAVLARARLESLCRELQRQNKIIKEESMVKIREEEELRREMASKFQSTLAEVTDMMNDNTEKNVKLRNENLEMANKMASICQQFEQGQVELTRIGHKANLDKQLADALRDKLDVERQMFDKEREVLQHAMAERERLLVEKESACALLQRQVESMTAHLHSYTGKYQEFESTISQSNRVFDNCKSEMGKMTKQIGQLENDLKVWKQRWGQNAKTVNELTKTKDKHEQQLVQADKKIQQLQKLCRQLQLDRAAYLKQLKDNSIEPVSLNETYLPPPPLSKKEQELQILKDNLKVLQDTVAGIQCKSVTEAPSNETEANVTVNLNGNDNNCTAIVDDNNCTAIVNDNSCTAIVNDNSCTAIVDDNNCTAIVNDNDSPSNDNDKINTTNEEENRSSSSV